MSETMVPILDYLDVTVAELLPGSYLPGRGYEAFTCLGWDIYLKTFEVIRDSPEVYGEQWPIYPYWKEWCQQRFEGSIPTGGETSANGAVWNWGCWEAAFRRIFASIDKHGFVPERFPDAESDIEVWIDPQGKLVVVQGNKRTALLRLFHGEKHPVQVKVSGRSEEWENLKRGLEEIGKGRSLYQPLDHPDLAGWPVTQPCTERLAMICGAWEPAGKTVLDLGCHTGWFCREFAKRGARVTGVDVDSRCIEAAQALGWTAPPHRYVHGPILDSLRNAQDPFDACLYLSLAMHTFADRDRGWEELRLVSEKCGRTFLDCVWGGYAERLPFTPETIAEEIIAHTSYTRASLLGYTDHEHRPLWHFWKEEGA